MTQRVKLVFPEPLLDELSIPGILSQKTVGNSIEIVVYPWNEEIRTEIQALNPSFFETRTMPLEEIFVSFVV